MEKFLRRNSYSSDERETSAPITTKSKNKTKSLESLSEPSNRTSQAPETPKTPKASHKDKQEQVKKTADKPKSMENTKVVVKQSGEKIDKKKSFNYESVIEITLPSAPTHLNTIVDVPRDKSQERLEEPITPVLCTPLKPKIPSQSNINMSPTSVHESHVSNKQNPMEWDSFIPVSSH